MLWKIICLVAIFCAPYSTYAKTHRSHAAIAAFEARHPCPANGLAKGPCKGYIIDHIKPLACGGADHPNNMQWQTVGDAKAKDKWERKDCAK
jgi:hypothetical protein